MQEQKGAMKAESALKAESAMKLLVVDLLFYKTMNIYIIKRYAHFFKKSPTSDDSANILEILYTS